MTRDCLATPVPFSAGTAAPHTALPAGACDSHMYVYDQRFPAAPGARLLLPAASVPDYRALPQRIGTQRTVLITPSTYGADNRCMLLGLAALKDPALIALADKLGVTLVGGTPQQLGDLQKADSAKWAKVIQGGGIKAD